MQIAKIMSAIFGLCVLLLVIVIIRISKARNKAQQQHNIKMKELAATEEVTLKHTVGLPLAENTWCTVFYCEDKIVIIGGGTTFNLSFDKINDITMTTDVEIQKAYISSVGGAVAGGLLFGPLGAIVGGRTKKKESRQVTKYLIITYIKDEKTEYISFDATENFKAGKLITLFKQRPQVQKATIEL